MSETFGFPDGTEPGVIVAKALEAYVPVRKFAMFSGGHDSVTSTEWHMEHVPDCEVLHCNTGIGIPRTREYVHDTCRARGWPLTEIRAKEDCGQDYDALVRRFGFPGPGGHGMMYRRLKERCVEEVVRRVKTKRLDRVYFGTGIYKAESQRRSGYGGRVINRRYAQVWVNPLYFWSQERFAAYRAERRLPLNPVKEMLGLSGECLCGAFAHKGEKALIRLVCPKTADRIERLEAEVRAAGHDWGWEDRPPRKERKSAPAGVMCMGCEKTFEEDVFS